MSIQLRWTWLLPAVLITGGTLSASGSPAASADAHASASLSTVQGNLPAAAHSARPLGPAPGSQRLSLQVNLRLRYFSKLMASIAELSDPRSSGFQRFLTPTQLTARYGPTRAQLDVVESYLRSEGIRITSINPQRNIIDANTTVSAANRAFRVSIMQWRSTGGQVIYSPLTNPVLPLSVAHLVLAVSGLDNIARLKPYTTTCTTSPVGGRPSGTCAEPAGVSNVGYAPAQLEKAYGITQLATSGLCGPKVKCDGSGQYIGILQFQSSWDPTNEAAFDSQYGLNIPSPSATAFCYPKTPCPIPVDSANLAIQEADLDVEAAHAIAPGARLLVYQTTEDVFSGLGNLLSSMLNDKATATTNSISYGTCEADVGSSQAYAMHQEFALLAMRGQVFFAASGDSGKYCFTHSGVEETGLSYPASDPLVTSVGGTNLFLNSEGSYAYEYAWSESGGGASSYSWNTRPSWQKGRGVPAGKRRLVPDVSADAFCSIATGCAVKSGYDYDITGPGTNYPSAGLGFSERTYCTATTQCWVSDGGTSLASPIWASVAAIYNQYARATGKMLLNGNVSAQLYQLAFRPHLHAGAITDITYPAENGADLSQNAASGWDAATGIGSPQLQTMVSDLPGLKISPKSGQPGSNVTLTGSAFRPEETVNVTDTTGTTASICTAAASATGTFTCTGQIPRSAPGGPQRVTAIGESSDGQATAQFNIVNTWTTTGILPPANAVSGEVLLQSIACGSPTSCTAVGVYSDNANNTSDLTGMLATGSGTSWASIESPLPANAAALSNVSLTSITCASATSCVAVGDYTDSAGYTDGLIVTGSGTTWTAIESPVPAGGDGAELTSVTCSSANSCVAVGTYGTASGPPYGGPLIVSGFGSSWTAAAVSSPQDAHDTIELSAVACGSATLCVATGSYYADSRTYQGLLVTGSGTSWTATKAAAPHGETSATLYSVACGSPTSCVAVGGYYNSSDDLHGYTLSGARTSWSAAVAPVPRNGSQQDQDNFDSDLASVTCLSATSCTAVGDYYSRGEYEGLLISGSGNSWAASEASTPSNMNSTGTALASVLCTSTSECIAMGVYDCLNANPCNGDSSFGSLPLAVVGSGTSWGNDIIPLPKENGGLIAIACPSQTSCVAAGNDIYSDSAFLTSGSP